MGRARVKALMEMRFPEVEWSGEEKPVLIVDGRLVRLPDVGAGMRGEAAYAVGWNERTFPTLCRHLRVLRLQLYELRVADLGPLTQLRGLRELAITWDTKVTSLDPLAELADLEVLVLEDLPKVRSIEPLRSLTKLVALDYSGGIWNRSRALTLEPLADLPLLEELWLTNMRVDEGGLRPLAGCPSLRRLQVSNRFETADYAYLAAKRPDIECDHFAPWIAVGVAGADRMVVGRRKPFLDSRKDGERITRYEQEFERLKQEFADD